MTPKRMTVEEAAQTYIRQLVDSQYLKIGPINREVQEDRLTEIIQSQRDAAIDEVTAPLVGALKRAREHFAREMDSQSEPTREIDTVLQALKTQKETTND